MNSKPLELDDIELLTPLDLEQEYVENNALIIDKIKTLEEAVIGLIKEKENKE